MKIEGVLLGLSLAAIVVLASLSINLLQDKRDDDVRIIYIDDTADGRSEPTEENQSEPLTRSDVARIATFNVQVFGKTKMGKAEVVSELVDIFHRYDMVAVQEIKDIDLQTPYNFLENLSNGSEVDWGMLISNRSGNQEDDLSSQEQYAFYYNKAIFSASDNGTLYNDSTSDNFQREPFVGHFELFGIDGNSTVFDFSLITIHTKPTAAVEEMDGLGDVVNWSLQYYADADQIILGDFNADCDYASYEELNSLSIANDSFIWMVPDNADTTVGTSRCAYDRIVTTGYFEGRLTGVWGIDSQISSSDISDHKPVWFDLSRL